MALSTFTLLRNHHCLPSPRHFHLTRLELWTGWTLTPHFPSPSPRQALFYFLWIRLLSAPHRSGIIQYLSLCVWLILLSIMSTSFIHVVAFVRISVLCKAEQHSVVCLYHISFIYPSVHDTWVVSTFCLIWIMLLWT